MSITATVENDTIKLPPGMHLPDGTEVEVHVSAKNAPRKAKLVRGEFGRLVLVASPDAPPDDPGAREGHFGRTPVSHLLDVNMLLACAWSTHAHDKRAHHAGKISRMVARSSARSY